MVTQLSKRLPLSEKSGYGYIQLPADTNPRDNTSYFSYGVEIPIHTAIVAPKSEAQQYFSLASAPPGYANQQAKTYLPHHQLPWDTLSLVIWQAPLPAQKGQKALLDFIYKGGTVAFYPPATTAQQSFLNTKWGLINKSSASKYFIIQDWDRKDGPLRNGEDGSPILVSKLKSVKRREILSNSNHLASWTNGSPFLTRELHGLGAAYFISTLPDYTWSNLGDADVILPLTQRMLLQGNKRFGSDHSSTIGQLPFEISVDAAKRKRLDRATENNALNAQYETGVYQFGERTIAINRPASEGHLLYLGKEDLDAVLPGITFHLFEERSENPSSLALQLWQFFLVSVLFFLIIEALLCLVQKRNKIEFSK